MNEKGEIPNNHSRDLDLDDDPYPRHEIHATNMKPIEPPHASLTDSVISLYQKRENQGHAPKA